MRRCGPRFQQTPRLSPVSKATLSCPPFAVRGGFRLTACPRLLQADGIRPKSPSLSPSSHPEAGRERGRETESETGRETGIAFQRERERRQAAHRAEALSGLLSSNCSSAVGERRPLTPSLSGAQGLVVRPTASLQECEAEVAEAELSPSRRLGAAHPALELGCVERVLPAVSCDARRLIAADAASRPLTGTGPCCIITSSDCRRRISASSSTSSSSHHRHPHSGIASQHSTARHCTSRTTSHRTILLLSSHSPRLHQRQA